MENIHSHLDEAIKRYLVSETNYAILISGTWGAGKTYYYNNHLVEIIRNTQVIGNETSNYLPIKISLFGKKSISEITDEIYSQVFPFLESNLVKKGGKLAFNAALGYLKNKTDVDLKEYIPEGFLDIKKKIQYQQIVLCFDDLERVSKDLKHEEIIGYINTLVENDSAKVIIIANENKIETNDYNIIKEKTIGITVEFSQTLENVFDAIIFEKYAATNINYFEFLTSEKALLLNLLNIAENNLRHITFTLDILSNVYEESLKVDPQISATHLINIVLFVISTSIEFRKRSLTKNNKVDLTTSVFLLNNLNWLPTTGKNSSTDNNSTITQESKRDILQQIKDKYYNPSYNYIFFSHIFDYITLSIFLKPELLKEDIVNAFPKEQELPDYSKVFVELYYNNLGSLTSSEYRTKTSQLIKYAKQGRYKIVEIITVFRFAVRFNNPLNFNKDKLVDSIIKGIRLNNENKYSHTLPYEMEFDSNDPDYIYLNKISSAALEINDSLQNKQNKQKALSIKSLLETDLEKFGNEVGYYNSEYYYLPIFENFKPRDFFKFIKNSNFDSLRIIYNTLQNRYRKNRELERYASEKPFFEALSNLLQQHVNKIGVKSHLNYMVNLISNEVSYAYNSL